MIHQYKLNGYNIILDTYSGAVHVTDEVAYDAIAGLDAGKDRETIGRELMETYRDRGLTMEDVADTFSDIDELIQDGKLFTKDVFEDKAFDLKKPFECNQGTVSSGDTHLQSELLVLLCFPGNLPGAAGADEL